MMKKRNILVLLTLTIIIQLILVTQVQAQEAKQLFQKGLMVENGEGDLQSAIKIYEGILADENAEDAVKAKAQLHIGLCYEKLGREEAIKAYETVVQDYKKYKEEYKVASSRLSELTIKEEDDDLKMIKLYNKEASSRDGTKLEAITLSPDGKHILGVHFLEGQNVAIQDVETKEVKLITHYSWTDPENATVTYYPIFSPDGKEIVYWFQDYMSGTAGLEIANLDGKTRRLVVRKEVKAQLKPRQWTADGKYILTYLQDTTGIWTISMVSTNDGSVRPIHKTQWPKDRFISKGGAVSPDGRFIVFADGPSDNHDIFIIDLNSESLNRITNNPMNDTEPLWSPDGKYIVYVKEAKGGSYLYRQQLKDGKSVGSPVLVKESMQDVSMNNWTEHGICCTMQVVLHDIFTMDMDPETGFPSTNPMPLDYTPTGINQSPLWSHDGKYLAFYSKENDPELVIIPMDGGEILHFPIYADGYWFMGAHYLYWLPDNSGIGFDVMNSNDEAVMHMLDIASGEWTSRNLPMDGHTRVAYGADDNVIYYTDVFEDTTAGVFQWNLETDETTLLAKIIGEEDYYVIQQLTVSPDYKKVAFLLNNTNLMMYDLESGEGGLFKENYWSPAFTPDSKNVIAEGYEELATFSLDGDKLHTYPIRSKFQKGTLIWGFDCSPDAKKLAFHTRTWIIEDYLMVNVLK